MNRALLRAVLDTAVPRLGPIELTEATTVAAGREAIRAGAVDVVVLDVRLPDGNGLELAREIDAGSSGSRPKILVMSASVLPSDRALALAAGTDGFLGKPFLPRELIDLLDAVMRDDGTRQAADEQPAAPKTPG